MRIGNYAWIALAALLFIIAGPAVAQRSIIYVDRSNVGFQDGLSWQTAVTTIQQGLRRAELQGGAEVWVAAGTYSEAIVMQAGTDLYGGFVGNERNREQRNFSTNLTTINGATANAGQPVETVVFGASNATIDGFIIRGGRGPAGAGMLNFDASPTVRNCVFTNNVVVGENGEVGSGGAMFNGSEDGTGSFPIIENCEFRGNSADGSGGAIANANALPEIRNCLFFGNATQGAGGAIANAPGSAGVIVDCVFRLNTAVGGGGAIYNEESSAIIERCIFDDNFVSAFGGAIFNALAEPLIVNCVFYNNVASNRGGAITNLEAEAIIINSTFANNVAGEFGGAIFNNLADARATNCILWDNEPEEVANVDSDFTLRFSNVDGGAAGTGNISSDPRFRDPENGDYSLLPTSRAINAGTANGAPQEDIEGIARPQGDGVDMGAYEATEIEEPPSLPLGGCIVINFKESTPAQAGNGVILGLAALALATARRRRKNQTKR